MRMKILTITTIMLLIFCNFIVTAEVKNDNIIDKINNKESSWQQINEDGFGDFNNRGPRGFEIFNDSIIIGTANYNNDSRLVFDKPMSIGKFLFDIIFNTVLNRNYLRSNGCEIWAFNNSTGWSQLIGNKEEAIMDAGFGNKNNTEIGTLIKYKGFLYAGVKNTIDGSQIWRTKSIDDEWELVAEEGLGNKNNIWFMESIVFNDYLYFGTYNSGDGCELFRTNDGINWETVIGKGASTKSGMGTLTNFYVWSSVIYNDTLYIGTNNLNGGGELWKSIDGINWKPEIAYMSRISARLHGAKYPRGFTSSIRNIRGGIRSMAVYNNELYIGFCGEDIRSNIFLGKYRILNFGQGVFMCSPIRRFISLGLDIFKYNSTTDKWTKVIGGIFKGNTSSGFGNPRNEYPWSMITHGKYLYVGTLCSDPINIVFNREKFLKWSITFPMSTGKGELWRFDGINWEKINEDGFGNKYNVGIRELGIYHNNLYAFTMNCKTGCQAWRYNLS